jgi:hypothetical protein
MYFMTAILFVYSSVLALAVWQEKQNQLQQPDQRLKAGDGLPTPRALPGD